ncbi:hypothetical protein NQZ68_016441 [Dissostichus eleginoides]|nr:hypothetical protein NQZ68_016441 [Dissostichus eleginoides]
MGQKLEKLSEKDEESLDSSDWSGQTEETEQSETARPDESRDQDDGSFATPLGIGGSSPATGHQGDLPVTSALTDPQTGQPIRHQGQQEHHLNTKGEMVGGDKESRSVSPTAEKSKTILSPKETSQTLNKSQGWRKIELGETFLRVKITFHDLPGMPIKKKVMRRKAGEDLTPFHS